jgi:uncharacterized protein (DUF1501 family)
MNRRDFLKLSMAGASTRLYAVPAASPRFLLVFLRGGYDAANLLVPASNGYYYEARPNIAVSRDSVLTINTDWALHPALRDTVYRLYQKGEVAFVPFAGTEDLTRSHFETQDGIELGQPLGRGRDYQSGFLNRLVSVLRGPRPISFTAQLPIVFRGESQVPNMALKTLGRPNVDAHQSRLISEMYRGNPLGAQVNEGFVVRDEVMRDLNAEMQAANRSALSARSFEAEARRIARLMKEQYGVGFVDVGGWDTHVGEGGASGYLAGRLEELGRGLAAFAGELGPVWRDTIVAVISEFGRTFRENGNRGTDHGHGSVYWFLGGAVRGGRIAGETVPVGPGMLFQNRDYPVLNEYRALFGGLFSRMYGLDRAQLERVFPGASARDAGLI